MGDRRVVQNRGVAIICRASNRPVGGRETPPTAMPTVHHLNDSRSRRVLWLLEELGVPYDIRHYQRDPATMLAPR